MPRKNVKSRYRSEIAAAIHETMRGIHAARLIPDATMKAFNASCLVANRISSYAPRDCAGRGGPKATTG